jgi:single-strand DNA-binding protein
MRFSANGQPKTEFSVATTRSWKKDDQWMEETDWHAVVLWGARAERAAEVLRKGMQVYVEGRQTNRSYEDKDGVKKYRSEVIADVCHQLGNKADRDASTEYQPTPQAQPVAEFAGAPRAAQPARRDDDLDDLPF